MAHNNNNVSDSPDTSFADDTKDDGMEIADAEPSEARTDFPCSVAQERFWLLDRLEPGNPSLNVAVRWRLEGTVSTALLERAWLRIIERHEVLRTVFLEIASVPVQRVRPRSPFKLAEIDLSNLAEDARQAEGDRIGVIEARAPFDLVAGPLLRATLLRLSPTVAVLLVTTHQIVSDGWSIGVMAREMGEIYRALRLEEPEPLEELPLQYADYSLWQLEWLRARGTAAETAYWTKQLADIKPFAVMPDRPRPVVPTTNGAIASIVLPRDLTNRAQALTAEHGATLFAAALAALTATLSRYTGESEIVIGTQVSDRDQVELEGMVGQFVNSLILRNDLSGDPRFGELIERSRDTINQALEYRHIPIERLLGMVKTSRDSVHSALISVNFIFQRTFIQNADYGDFKLIDLPSLPAGAIYDLNFFMVERPDGWRFSCQYNTDQFEGETAYRLLDYVRKTLASAVDKADRRVSQLALIDAEERERQLAIFGGAWAEYPVDALPRLFEAQVARTPDSVALTCGERRLSYRQVDAEANRLARHLIARGVGPGVRVGICLDRSAELPIAWLAIMKTGAAFATLDPGDPPARLLQLIDGADLHTVITRTALKPALARAKTALIDLDADKATIARQTATVPETAIVPESEACLFFVASPDARPNGIRISHRALIARLWGLRERPGLRADDVLVAVTPATLDLAAFELLLPLLVGARVVIASSKDVADGRHLLHLLQRSQATVMHAVPALWTALIAAEWHGQPRLRMLCSGEGRDRRLAAQLLDRGSELWSLYVCAETTICAAVHRLTALDDFLPIGTPLANTRLYVLGPQQQLLPTGAVGELYIGGDSLAPGELETRAIPKDFVADPFDAMPGARLYRSGDLVRLRHGGQIEALGRRDQRATRQGYRIEPAEIETVLRRHPNVGDAAVLIVPDLRGQPALMAYVEPSAGTTPGHSEALIAVLQIDLARSLPVYLQLAAVIVVDALPRLADGGVDRRALRHSAESPASATRHSPLPGNDIEHSLLKLWRTMLGREDIDTATNFFESGGHSLLAARMLARVESEFGRRISLAALFRAPSVHELAQLLERDDLRDYDFRQVVKLQPVGSRPPLTGVNNTGIYYLLAKRLGSEQPFTSLQLFDPSVRDGTLPKTLEEIAAGYVTLIRRVQPVGPYSLMGWCVAGALSFEIARQLVESKQEVLQLYLMDSWVPNYLKRLPTLRSRIGDYSLRWAFIAADWRRVQARQLGFSAFLDNRALVKKLREIFGRRKATAAGDTEVATGQATPEDYDQWLLGYLQEVTARYEPRHFRGRITLFRSRREPTGWWFDPLAGWGPFADSIDLHLVDGDHFTMFQEPGVSQMAQMIDAISERGGS